MGIPVGFDGVIRRIGPGSTLQIDHSHPELEFNLILRGQGAYVLGRSRIDLRPGVLVWLQPGQQHRLVRSADLEMWVLSAHPDVVDEAFRRDVAAAPLRLLSGDDAVSLDRLLTQVSQDADEPGLFNSGLGYALRRARRASRDSAGQEREVLHPAVLKALLLLRRHVDAPSLDDVASASGVTQSYLSRLLVQQTGRGFTEWRNRARLERFHVAYAESRNLAMAAQDAGFGSYVQFHRVCRELMGYTPREWVQSWSRDDAAAFIPPSAAGSMALHDGSKPHAASERTGKMVKGLPLPALPSAHGILPSLDDRRRVTWYPLAGLILPGVLRWCSGHFFKELLSCEATAISNPATSRDPTRFVRAPEQSPEILDRQLRRLRPSDVTAAVHLEGARRQVDLYGLCTYVLLAYGFETDNVTDAATAALSALWVAANGAADPNFAQGEALRLQCRRALARTTTLAAVTDLERQEAHEVFAYQFSITYNALAAARASSNAATLHAVEDAVADAVRTKLGWDLKTVQFDERGFSLRKQSLACS